MLLLRNLFSLCCCLFSTTVFTQTLPPYKPSAEEMRMRYKKAEIMDSVARNKVFKTNLQANWQADGESFWYKNILPDSVTEYILVHAGKRTKQPAFDHTRLAKALEAFTPGAKDPHHLVISNIYYDKSGRKMRIQVDGKWLLCDLGSYKLDTTPAPVEYIAATSVTARGGNRFNTSGDLNSMVRRARAFRSDTISPDKSWRSFVRGGNIFLSPVAGGEDIQLTTNGSASKPYGYVTWSPDSRTVVAYHINPVVTRQVHYVLTSASGTRGELKSRPYAQPGDENTSFEMFVFDVPERKQTRVKIDTIDFSGPPLLTWRMSDNNYFTFERVDRGHQRFRIIEVDRRNGNAKELIDEKTNTFIFEQRIFTHYLNETNELVWVTEKDGWRHMYLMDMLTGKEKNAITKGEWVVREIDSIDHKKREIWFQASGMNHAEDPYFIHYYRIGFDGKNLIKLTRDNANHRVSFSPGRKYYIDNYSRVDMPPVIELKRTADGKKLMELERADITKYLATGIKLPEVFVAKARDGKTDIWGIIFRPANFDSSKSYPIIEQIYAGPQGSFVPKSFAGYGETQSLAELGFVVVQIDGMGTYNRSKAFHDVCWKNIADAGFPDRILWMKALASRYPWADTSRVGVYGTSAGGQNAAGAVLFHPNFYDAAVSACGCHDNRVDKQWWNEQWMGYPVGKHYDEQSNVTHAHKLQGALFLIVGEADENVPPESTYRVADALIKAEKSFEFLAVPGLGHSDGGPYGRKRKRDFFVKQLLGVDAPSRNTAGN